MKHSLALIAVLWLSGCALFGAPTNCSDNAVSTDRAISVDLESVDDAMNAIARLASAGIAPHGIEVQANVGARCVLRIHLESQQASEDVADLIRPRARQD